MKRSAMLVAGGVAAMQLTGCMSGEIEDVSSGDPDAPTFEEFEAATYREPDTGLYIVGGDTPHSIKELRELYDHLHPTGDALIVHRPGGTEAKWSATQKLNLTYCVSNSFGSSKQRVISAMASATGAWMAAANVKFTYVPAQDGSCSASNSNVMFDVSRAVGQPYLARAFFPGDPRSERNVVIDTSSFAETGSVSLVGILTHELGHVLGFRHEHTRPESGTRPGGQCYEDSEWRALTSYDSGSVMHYPHCLGSTNAGDLVVTAKDKQGAAALYGAPGSNPNPDPNPDPNPGTPRTESISGSARANEMVVIKTVSVRAGTEFTASFTSGSGDPDLYVRFNAAPTTSTFACRSWQSGPVEQCTGTVPSGATTAYIAVRGYEVASSARGSVTYTAR